MRTLLALALPDESFGFHFAAGSMLAIQRRFALVLPSVRAVVRARLAPVKWSAGSATFAWVDRADRGIERFDLGGRGRRIYYSCGGCGRLRL